MTGVEKITAHIRAEGRLAREQILMEAAAVCSQIRAEQEIAYRQEAQALRQGMEMRLHQMQQSQRDLLRMEQRQTVLREKQREIAAAFDHTRQNLEALEEGRRIALYLCLLDKTGLAGEAGEVVLWEKDGSAVAAALREHAPALSVAGTRCPHAGFYLRCGAVEVDCTFAALLEEQNDALRKRVAEVLFREENDEAR